MAQQRIAPIKVQTLPKTAAVGTTVAVCGAAVAVAIGLGATLTAVSLVPGVGSYFQVTPPGTWRSDLFPASWRPVDEAVTVGTNVIYDPVGILDEAGVTVAPGNPAYHPYRYLHDFSYAGYHAGADPIPPLVQVDCLARGRPVFRVTDYGCTPNPSPQSGGSDCRAAIQSAINAAQTSGGGIVYFPAGEYVITTEDSRASLSINTSNVVLCGAGTTRTYLKVDPRRSRGSTCREPVTSTAAGSDLTYRTFCAHESSLIAAEPPGESGNGWLQRDLTKLAALAKDYEFPTRRLQLTTMPFAKNDEIVIYAGTRTTAYLDEHDMNDPQGWPASERAYVFRRKVADVIGTEIVLDVPTRYRLKRSDGVRVVGIAAGHEGLRELGIEQLSIGMVRHPDDWDMSGCANIDPKICQDERIGAAGTAFKFPVIREIYDQRMIDLANVSQSYIYDLSTYRPTENGTLASFSRGGRNWTYPVEFLNSAIYMKHARLVTVDKIRVQGSQVDRGSHNGYALWMFETNEVLFRNGNLKQVKKGFAFNNGGASGNVVKDMVFEDILDYENDFHSYLSMANLIDNNTLDGTYWEAAVRPLSTTRHGHGTTETVFWNTRGVTDPSVSPELWIDTQTWWNKDNNDDGVVDSPGILDYGVIVSNQFGWGYVIGTLGNYSDVVVAKIPNRAYSGADLWRPTIMPRDYTEGIGYDRSADPKYAGKTLYPRSLYEAQLALRLGTGCTPIWSCTAWAPSSCTTGTQTRTCTDTAACGSTSGKPLESQTCLPTACIENWSCTAWAPSPCTAGSTQTRTCTDANTCGTAATKPAESQTCPVVPPPPPATKLKSWCELT